MRYSHFIHILGLQFLKKKLYSGSVFYTKNIAVSFFIFIVNTAFAQNAITFESSVDKQKIALNEYVEVSFAVGNAQPDAFIPPQFNDFNIAGGPNQSSEMSVINGAVCRNVTYSFYLSPKNIGSFSIPAAIIKYRGRQFQTQPLTVTVVKGKGKITNTKPNPFAGFRGAPTHNSPKSKAITTLSDVQLGKGIFIKVETNKREAFVGEQITVDYKLYTRYGLSGKQFVQLPQLKGFFPVEFKQFDSNTRRENIGGVSYSVQTLRKVALYPQQEGTLTIDELGLEVGVLTDNTDDPLNDPFFGGSQVLRPYTVHSISMPIKVRGLPREQPQKFSGAIGAYAMQSVAVPTDVTTDDAVSVTLTITGNGDPKRVAMPNIGLDDSSAFEIYEPKVTDRSEETANDITGQKNYEITLIPRKVGKFMIAPTFTYFDTQTKQYKTLQPKTFEINVAKGTKPIVAYNPADTTVASAREPRLLRPQRSVLGRKAENRAENHLLGSRLFWLLFALPFAAIGAMFVYKRVSDRRANLDTNRLRQERANNAAQQRLAFAKNLQTSRENAHNDDFYSEIQKTLLGYIGDKFGIANENLNKPFLKTFLSAKNVEIATINRLIAVLEHCEITVFGGTKGGDSAQNSIFLEETKAIIIEIEEIVKKIV